MTSDPVARALRAMIAQDPTAKQFRLAEALDKHQSTISRYMQGSGDGGLDLPALLVPAVTAELGDLLIERIARLCGGMFVREAPEPRAESCTKRSIEGVQSAVQYQAEAAEAEQDRKITREEHLRLLHASRKALEFAQERVAHHEACLREMIAADVASLSYSRSHQ